MSRRVVVTGMGAITPVGLNVEDFWQSLKDGKHGFATITRFDSSEYKAHVAAEVKGFEGKDYMDFKAAKRMELFCQYAVAAAGEALRDSGIDMEKEDPFRVGVSVGSGIGSLQAGKNGVALAKMLGVGFHRYLLFLLFAFYFYVVGEGFNPPSALRKGPFVGRPLVVSNGAVVCPPKSE